MDATKFTLEAIGTVTSTRHEAFDDGWDAETAAITLDARFDARAVAGLDAFSHVEVIYVFDRVDPATVCTTSRHPRGNPDWPDVGIFAQRAKDRPNRLGLSTCELLAVEGTTLHVRGLDAVDGTPVLDVKPHMQEFGPRSAVRQPTWSRELMARYH